MIRDRFSPDAWRALDDLVAIIHAPLAIGPAKRAMIERVEAALRIISSFSGLAQENMTQLAGWRFLEARPPHRARHSDLPLRALASPTARAGRRPRRAAGTGRQPDHLPAALRDDRGTGAGDRPRRARPEQSAFGRLPARPDRSPSRRVAETPPPTAGCRPSQQIAASIATRLRTADATQLDDALIIDDRRRADETVGGDRRRPISPTTSDPKAAWEALA